MSDTLRTDTQAYKFEFSQTEVVDAYFARRLERELNEVKQKLRDEAWRHIPTQKDWDEMKKFKARFEFIEKYCVDGKYSNSIRLDSSFFGEKDLASAIDKRIYQMESDDLVKEKIQEDAKHDR